MDAAHAIDIVNIITIGFQSYLGAMVWYYLLGAIVLSVLVIGGSFVAMDVITYRSLQRRLQEERRRRESEKQTVSAHT